MFTSYNPTIGTAVAITATAQGAFTATAPAFLIKNNDAAGGKDVILKRLTMVVGAAGSTLTSLDCAVVVDATNRYTSGGATASIVNVRSDQSNSTVAQIYQASTAIVSPAATASARMVARRRLRSQIPVISDQYILNFGTDSQNDNAVFSGTTSNLVSLHVAPVVIPPQSFALIYLWGTSMAGIPTVEWLLEHVER